jgi:hypothetical protein
MPPAAGGNDFPRTPLISNPLKYQLRGRGIISLPEKFERLKPGKKHNSAFP